MKNFLFIWANTLTTKYINYHFTHLGEVIDYLDNIFINEIDILDADAENLDCGKILEKMSREDYKAVAFYVGSENVREATSLAETIKNIFPDIKLIAYGPLTVLIPGFFTKTKFDAIYVDGDYEVAIESFFKFVKGEIAEDEVKGVKLIRNNELISTKKGEFIDFEKLGFSRLDRLPIKAYNELNKDEKIVITLSRGCPYTCPHCLVQICEGHVDRRRSLKKLEEYLNTIYPKYTEIKVFSPDFTLNKQYVYDFCDLIIKKFPKLKWDCATRVNLSDDIDLLKKMQQAGCTYITLGIETLSKDELNNLGKNYDLDKLEECMSKIRSCNMDIKACIILGIKGQTKESLRNTIEILSKNGARIRPFIYTPYHELTDDMMMDDIENYSKKLLNNSYSELTNKELVKLLYNIEDYKEILK